MTNDEKLRAILAAVQIDPGNRGLAKVPENNLFTATVGDFQAACRSLAECPGFRALVYTGFCIPFAPSPSFETDGPPGAYCLERAAGTLGGFVEIQADEPVVRAIDRARQTMGHGDQTRLDFPQSHAICVERAGRAADGRRYTMQGRDVSEFHNALQTRSAETPPPGVVSIGIGDGGNEIGMGKIPHETIVANIPRGDLIHCRVPTDHLIVAGVSNWGAYALAAGLFVLRGVKPPDDLFDPDREFAILEIMVREGPLVDGVTGKSTTTVDGLTWNEYRKPLIRIREILES